MLRLGVVEHLSKITRVERLAADWAVDKVLRFVLHRPVMRLCLGSPSGWPNAFSAAPVAREVFEKRANP
ncbi:hypothetical protein [Mesorhizobium sp. M0814]|uniref:hypothetical protein n=1 Tax=unclassified Mesorhizobium TaxID=325217 RepID=UPI0033375001